MSDISIDLLSKGGPLMWALLVCSIISLAVILERIISLRKKKLIPIDQLIDIETCLKQDKFHEALDICQQFHSPMMRIAKVALMNSNKSKEDLKSAIEEAGRLEVPYLERYLSVLNTIVVISPLLGLLGTVMGMIEIFTTIQNKGIGEFNYLAGGISEALITTATGMSIAIPTVVFYNFFSRKVDVLLSEMERHSLIMYDLVIRKS